MSDIHIDIPTLKGVFDGIQDNFFKIKDNQRQLNDAKLHRDSIEGKVENNITKLLGIGDLKTIQPQINLAKIHRDSIESKLKNKSNVNHSHAGSNITNTLKGFLVGGGTASVVLIGVGAYLLLRTKILKKVL